MGRGVDEQAKERDVRRSDEGPEQGREEVTRMEMDLKWENELARAGRG
jgi:hypothetical protein